MTVLARTAAAACALAVGLVALLGGVVVALFTYGAATTTRGRTWDGHEICAGTFGEAVGTGVAAAVGAGIDAALFVVAVVAVGYAVTGRVARIRRLAPAVPLATGAVAAVVGVALLFQLDDPPAPPC